MSEVLTKMKEGIQNGELESTVVDNDNITVKFKGGIVLQTKKERGESLVKTLETVDIKPDQAKISVDDNQATEMIMGLLSWIVPTLAMILIFYFLIRQARVAGDNIFSFAKSRAKMFNKDLPQIRFGDVAGVDEAKQELREVVEFLKTPEKFRSLGAKIPKGVLLVGPSGVGKTLLARTVAGEAAVPFFSIAGSEFMEMLVGVGASRVRDLFEMAKKSSPAIIFIDEVDSIGRQRGLGLGGGHDEREQTLNQILVEMDGFEPQESVIVMAGTNRPDVLDPALLRPGRFDRRVILDNPDINDREAILKLHSQKKPLEKGVDLRVIAERTPGFSGADLANLMNEAAIVAARDNRKTIEQLDLYRSIEKVLLGPERKSHILSTAEKKISAYHEAGHALVAAILPHADPVHKITIVSRGRAAGYTLKLPSEDRHLYSRKNFLDELAAALGGYASEKVVFGELTTGSSDDIKKATIIARDLVTRYGMSEKIGPITLGDRDELVFLGKELGVEKNYSENTAQLVDSEVSNIMKNAFKRAQDILKKYRKVLDSLAAKLIKDETIEREEFESILSTFGLIQVIGKHAEAMA